MSFKTLLTLYSVIKTLLPLYSVIKTFWARRQGERARQPLCSLEMGIIHALSPRQALGAAEKRLESAIAAEAAALGLEEKPQSRAKSLASALEHGRARVLSEGPWIVRVSQAPCLNRVDLHPWCLQ